MPRDHSDDIPSHDSIIDPFGVRGRSIRRRSSVGNSFFNPDPVSYEEFTGTSTLPYPPSRATSPVSPTIVETSPDPSPVSVDDFSQSLDFALWSQRSE